MGGLPVGGAAVAHRCHHNFIHRAAGCRACICGCPGQDRFRSVRWAAASVPDSPRVDSKVGIRYDGAMSSFRST